jgi:hypothetical protein
MKLVRTILALTSFLAPARADVDHQFVQLPGGDPQMVWFQALNTLSQPAAAGHSGMLPLGMEAYASPGFPPALWGGWFSWTAAGAYLSYAGGTLSTTDIHSPSGAAITDVRGATYLASALDVMVDAGTGDIFAVTLYSGLLFWTPSHVYLLLVGGVPTVYEVTTPAGAPIANVRGIARLAAQVLDMDTGPAVDAVLWSGAMIYTDTQLFLTRTHTVVSTSEITLGGASIANVRGVLPLGGKATPIALDAAAYVWTKSKLILHVAGGTSSTGEVLDPSGAPIADVWGMTRCGSAWSGSGTYHCAATIFQPTRQLFVNTIGAVAVQESFTGTGTSIRSDVKVAGNNAMLRQGGSLMEVYAIRSPGGGSSQRGTVVGLGQ